MSSSRGGGGAIYAQQLAYQAWTALPLRGAHDDRSLGFIRESDEHNAYDGIVPPSPVTTTHISSAASSSATTSSHAAPRPTMPNSHSTNEKKSYLYPPSQSSASYSQSHLSSSAHPQSKHSDKSNSDHSLVIVNPDDPAFSMDPRSNPYYAMDRYHQEDRHHPDAIPMHATFSTESLYDPQAYMPPPPAYSPPPSLESAFSYVPSSSSSSSAASSFGSLAPIPSSSRRRQSPVYFVPPSTIDSDPEDDIHPSSDTARATPHDRPATAQGQGHTSNNTATHEPRRSVDRHVPSQPPPSSFPSPAVAAASPSAPAHTPSPAGTANNRPVQLKSTKRGSSQSSLDRIDELDETNLLGHGWHHEGPYEAARRALRGDEGRERRHDGRERHAKHRKPPHNPTPDYSNFPSILPGQIVPKGFGIEFVPGSIFPERLEHVPDVSRAALPFTNHHFVVQQHARPNVPPGAPEPPMQDLAAVSQRGRQSRHRIERAMAGAPSPPPVAGAPVVRQPLQPLVPGQPPQPVYMQPPQPLPPNQQPQPLYVQPPPMPPNQQPQPVYIQHPQPMPPNQQPRPVYTESPQPAPPVRESKRLSRPRPPSAPVQPQSRPQPQFQQQPQPQLRPQSQLYPSVTRQMSAPVRTRPPPPDILLPPQPLAQEIRPSLQGTPSDARSVVSASPSTRPQPSHVPKKLVMPSPLQPQQQQPRSFPHSHAPFDPYALAQKEAIAKRVQFEVGAQPRGQGQPMAQEIPMLGKNKSLLKKRNTIGPANVFGLGLGGAAEEGANIARGVSLKEEKKEKDKDRKLSMKITRKLSKKRDF